MAQTSRGCNLWRSGSNVHLSLVSIDVPFLNLPPIHPNTLFKFAVALLTENSDVLRRRFQINTMTGMGYQYKSIWDAVRVIVAEEGLRGLFKGIGPNLLKVAPSMASSWLSFEMTRDFLVSMGDKD